MTSGTVLVGTGWEIHREPDDAFVKGIEGSAAHMVSRLSFMTRNHDLIRDFVVRELPRLGGPVSPLAIAEGTGLGLPEVSAGLLDLESHLFFLVRNEDGEVAWAFPVTAAATPHRLTFSTGEKIFGA